MSEAAKVSGPDLAVGIEAGELKDGEPLVGHVGDEGVMLVRRGDEIFAVGATCTHYSGPLGEGLIVGDTVRCPWHHACFDLRTGEAVRAPALNPIACFDVEREGNLVRIGAKKTIAPPTAPEHAPEKIVIVGAGAAGHACAEELRKRGHRGQIVLIGADADGPVDRPNLRRIISPAPRPRSGSRCAAKIGTPSTAIEVAVRQPRRRHSRRVAAS